MRDQQHPLWNTDRQIVDTLLKADEPTEMNLAELARLRIRYNGFPGARDIQADLDELLQRWRLTEDELFSRTRQIHNQTRLYDVSARRSEEDWS